MHDNLNGNVKEMNNASLAIVRSRKFIIERLHLSSISLHNRSKACGWFSGSSHEEGNNGSVKVPPLLKELSRLDLSTRILLDSQKYFVPQRVHEIGRVETLLPLGIRWMPHSIRAASTATAKEPTIVTEDDPKEEVTMKQIKEASPEECDHAVECLCSAKAKVKQVQEAQKKSKSVTESVWAVLLRIGPALQAVASMSRNKFWDLLQHYWLGTKLLWADIRICSRLLGRISKGKTLSRRERQQLTRTTADIFRLVPFAVFVVVPFMEFLLPAFLKVFPNMLPSTFQDKMKEQEALKRQLNARIEYARFLQDTVKEMANEVQLSCSGEIKKTAEDLHVFLSKARTGGHVSNEEILGFAKLFNDELTLDNISRPGLVNMCRYMEVSQYGTGAYLRYMLRKRLAWIKNDDKMIQAEGVESLSEVELRQACRDRGQLGLLSVQEMRQQLLDWLDLSLNHSVPSSLLILSRALTLSGKVGPEEAVQVTLSSLPDEVVDTVGVAALPSEDSLAERRRKLEFLEMQEELIKEEAKEEDQETQIETIVDQEKIALHEMVMPTGTKVQELSVAALEKQEQLCKLSRALAVLASTSSVCKERDEFLSLVNMEIELYNGMVQKESKEGEEETRKVYRAAREESDHATEIAMGLKISSALINKASVDTMLQKVEREIDDVDVKIGNRWRLLDRDYDGKVTPEEVAAAAMYLKDSLSQDGIQELISNLAKDREGKILVQDIVRFGADRCQYKRQIEG